MRIINKGLLIDFYFILNLIFNFLLKKIVVDSDLLTKSVALGLTFILYGIFLILFYLIKPTDDFGLSRSLQLLLGVVCFVLGPVFILFNPILEPVMLSLVAIICIIHGLTQILFKKIRGFTIKLFEIINGSIDIGLGFCILFMQNNKWIESNLFILITMIVVLIDILVTVVSIIHPRDDLENTSVEIHYSSMEDRIKMKPEKKLKVKNEEVIDLNQLFKDSLKGE